MHLNWRKLTLADVSFTFEHDPEDYEPEAPRDMSDGRDVAAIRKRLRAGDTSAWCGVRATARWRTFEATAYIGACSLSPRYTAEACAREHGLHLEALELLNAAISRAASDVAPLLLKCSCETCKAHDAAVARGYYEGRTGG